MEARRTRKPKPINQRALVIHKRNPYWRPQRFIAKEKLRNNITLSIDEYHEKYIMVDVSRSKLITNRYQDNLELMHSESMSKRMARSRPNNANKMPNKSVATCLLYHYHFVSGWGGSGWGGWRLGLWQGWDPCEASMILSAIMVKSAIWWWAPPQWRACPPGAHHPTHIETVFKRAGRLWENIGQ